MDLISVTEKRYIFGYGMGETFPWRSDEVGFAGDEGQ